MKRAIVWMGAAVFALMTQLAMASAVVGNLTGSAQAIPGAGAPRALKQGDRVNQGETVSTGAGSSIVLTFDDGQVVALTANARLAISTYNYNKAKPEESNVLLNLASGGMRAITGLIGKAKPSNVAYRAGNATIGIRGTDLEVGVGGDDLYVIAQSGAAEVEMAPARTGSLPLSGNMFGMSLPVATAPESFHLAQATTRFSVTVNQGFIRVQGINRNLTPAQIRQAVAVANSLAPAAQQLTAPQLQQVINAIVNTVQAPPAPGTPPGQQPPASIDIQRPATGQSGTGSGSGSGSGGGSTLPACSSISPASARQPGVNCTG